MRLPGGYLVRVDPETGTTERDTFTCSHCNRVKVVRPKEDAASLGGHCKLCDALVCADCAPRPCVPFEMRLEAAEARDRLRRAAEGA